MRITIVLAVITTKARFDSSGRWKHGTWMEISEPFRPKAFSPRVKVRLSDSGSHSESLETMQYYNMAS
jgi:hypothetical protein